jgi:hypothetical protein
MYLHNDNHLLPPHPCITHDNASPRLPLLASLSSGINPRELSGVNPREPRGSNVNTMKHSDPNANTGVSLPTPHNAFHTTARTRTTGRHWRHCTHYSDHAAVPHYSSPLRVTITRIGHYTAQLHAPLTTTPLLASLRPLL